jgi:hypothetical protein
LPKLLPKPKAQPSAKTYKLDNNWIEDNNNKNNNNKNDNYKNNNENNYKDKNILSNIQTKNLLYPIIIPIEIGASNKYPYVGYYNKPTIKVKPWF